MSNIHVLLLGSGEKAPEISLPAGIVLEYRNFYEKSFRKSYEMVVLDRTPSNEECQLLYSATSAHTLFISENVDTRLCHDYCMNKRAQKLESRLIPQFIRQYACWFFPSPYGEKYSPKNLSVSDSFSGEVVWDGSRAVSLTGDFGTSFSQVLFWRNNIPIEENQTIDFWLEYAKTADVEISMKCTLFASGSLMDTVKTLEFSEEDLKDVVHIKADVRSFLFVSICARGSGTLEMISLHDRYSRGPFGYFLPGGDRYVTKDREEIFAYFDPGDRKPPLNVYFSGYKTREGFEAYRLMRQMGAPFLLISEARLEGGSFYVGSPEFEELMFRVVEKYRIQLGFTNREMILSGISMGSTGALYYGCDLSPHAIIVGKPLVNLGTIAANEKLVRPGGFPTSLDLLLSQCGDLSEESIRKLNHRFWKKFHNADWSRTKLIISYMMEDDYDPDAYPHMVRELSMKKASIYGRGLHGRHNDNTGGIVQWFVSQYHKILREDFPDSSGPLREEIKK